jgi:hypothetical protein
MALLGFTEGKLKNSKKSRIENAPLTPRGMITSGFLFKNLSS